MPHKKTTASGKGRRPRCAGRLAALIFCALLLASPVHAAEETSPDVYQLPTVTVTAEKRTTDVQKTPSAITVLSETKLEDAKIDTVDKVLQHVPNIGVMRGPGGVTQMSMRGLITSGGTSTSPMIMYVDGVPMDTFYNMDAPLMDIERVEVLRGAQSAIYGKNAMGGVINVISKKPTNEWHGGLSTEYGSFDTYKVTGALNGPLIEDKLFIALSGEHAYSRGYMDNDTTDWGNQTRTERFKGQLRFTPTEDIDIAFHLNYTARRDGYSNLIWGNEPTLNSIANKDDHMNADIWNMALTAKVDFDPMTFESITTYRTENFDYSLDMLATAQYSYPLFDAAAFDSGRKNTRKEFTQEFRLRSPDDKKDGVQWLLGVFGGYTDMDIKECYSDMAFNSYMMANPYMPGTYLAFPAAMQTNQPSREFTHDLAGFGELTLPLTDALKVTLGLRAQYTHKKIDVNYDSVTDMDWTSMGVGMQHAVSHTGTTESSSWTELLPKFNISYQVTDDIMIYGGVNRSFIPGGFNNATTTGHDFEFDPQTAWNYEIGVKSEWFDKRLMINLAGFHSDVRDLQVMTYDVASMSYVGDNAGSASIWGVELDAMARILPGLDAELSFGYIWTRMDDYKIRDTTGQVTDYSGNKVPYTPDFTASFALQYRHECGLFLRGEVQHFGNMYWTEANEDSRGHVTLVNARVGYEFEPFGIYVYGNNLADQKYLEYYTPTSNYGMMARPREVGVQLTYKF